MTINKRAALVVAVIRPAAHPRFYVRSTDSATMVKVGRGCFVSLEPARVFGLITDVEYRGVYIARHGRPPIEQGGGQ